MSEYHLFYDFAAHFSLLVVVVVQFLMLKRKQEHCDKAIEELLEVIDKLSEIH